MKRWISWVVWPGLVALFLGCQSDTEVRITGGTPPMRDAEPTDDATPADDATPSVMDAAVDAAPMDADADAPMRDPRVAGAYSFINSSVLVPTMTFSDVGVELYVPEVRGEVPLIVFTTGRLVGVNGYRGLAAHLASHGFAVGFPIHDCSVFACPVQTLANQAIEVAQALRARPVGDVSFSSVGFMGHGVGASIAVVAASTEPSGGTALALLPNNTGDLSGTGFSAMYPDLRERIPLLGAAGVMGVRGGVDCIPRTNDSHTLEPLVEDLPRHVIWQWQGGGVSWLDVLSEPDACTGLGCRVCAGPSGDYEEFHQAVKTLSVAFFAQALLGENMATWLEPTVREFESDFQWEEPGI